MAYLYPWGYRTGAPFQVTVPTVYDECMSVPQQIAWLKRVVDCLLQCCDGVFTDEEFCRFFKWLEDDQTKQTEEIKKWAEKKIEETLDFLCEKGFLIYDPCFGQYPTGVEDTIWDVYKNVRYYANTAKRLDEFEFTAQQWDELGMTAEYFDLYSMVQLNPDEIVPQIGEKYELPMASANTLGGIKVGAQLEITPDGVLNCIATGGGGSGTVYKAGDGLTLSGDTFALKTVTVDEFKQYIGIS